MIENLKENEKLNLFEEQEILQNKLKIRNLKNYIKFEKTFPFRNQKFTLIEEKSALIIQKNWRKFICLKKFPKILEEYKKKIKNEEIFPELI